MPVRAPRFGEVVTRAHLPALDGLRAMAVFCVILSHSNYPAPGVPGDLGVSAFFVFSGFLITRLLLREHEATGDVSLKNFYARRTLRIFPAYYAFLAISFVVDRVMGDAWEPGLGLSALTYTVNYFNAKNGHPTTSISHAWSLAVEEQFYLLWPIAFVVLARRGRRAIIWGAAAAAVAAVIWRSWLVASDAPIWHIYNAFDTRFDNLAIGCLLALLADHQRVAAAATLVARRSWYPLITLALLIISRSFVNEGYHYSVGFTVNALLTAILMAQLMQLYNRPMWSWLEHPVTRYLGAISYPMYLYHLWGNSVGRRVPVGDRHFQFVGEIAATILLAAASYHVIEKPFLKLKRRFAARTTRPRATAPRGVALPANTRLSFSADAAPSRE